jgi:hypothetical protein
LASKAKARFGAAVWALALKLKLKAKTPAAKAAQQAAGN